MRLPRFSLRTLRHHIGGVRSAGVRFALCYALLFRALPGLVVSVTWLAPLLLS